MEGERVASRAFRLTSSLAHPTISPLFDSFRLERFIRFHGIRHPREMGKPEIERFLSDLAMNQNVAKATQSQAFNALLFLYRHVLHLPIEEKIEAIRSRKAKRLPTVLRQDEMAGLLGPSPGGTASHIELTRAAYPKRRAAFQTGVQAAAKFSRYFLQMLCVDGVRSSPSADGRKSRYLRGATVEERVLRRINRALPNHYRERVWRRYYKHRQFFVDVPYVSA